MGERATTRRRTTRQTIAMAMLTATVFAIAPAEPAGAATTIAGSWEMNEGGGAVMVDSGPHGIDGVMGAKINPAPDHYSWPYKAPNAPPAERDRLAIVDDDDRIDPDDQDYAIEFRYKTTHNFGNVVQKGQNASPGGYWKFEQPMGRMICLFKDEHGLQKAIRSPIATNDGEWHTIRCELSDWGFRLFVDGTQVASKQVSMGAINNSRPLSIGGKENCNQKKVTCDYFTGQIDYVRIEKGGSTPPPPPPPPPENEAPTAAMSVSCTDLTCGVDGTFSSDADGDVVDWAWEFGDGVTATGATAQHTFAAAGDYDITLTVTDDGGATGQTTQTVTVSDGEPPPPPPPPAADLDFVGAASETRWSTQPWVTVPAVEQGDTLLLFATAASPVQIGAPDGTGWQQVDSVATSKAATALWWKTATAADAGSTVRVSLSSGAKSNMTVVAYRGTAESAIAAHTATAISTSSAARTTPQAAVAESGSWVVSFWMHRDSSTTSLAPPAGVTVREQATMSGGGHPTVLVADSGGAVAAGTAGGLTATAQESSGHATAYTIVLAAG